LCSLASRLRRIYASHLAAVGGERMKRTNVLYVVIAGLVVVVGVLSYQLYQAKKEPTGVQLSIGERGISIEKK
jgi:hypothetical protein